MSLRVISEMMLSYADRKPNIKLGILAIQPVPVFHSPIACLPRIPFSDCVGLASDVQ